MGSRRMEERRMEAGEARKGKVGRRKRASGLNESEGFSETERTNDDSCGTTHVSDGWSSRLRNPDARLPASWTFTATHLCPATTASLELRDSIRTEKSGHRLSV